MVLKVCIGQLFYKALVIKDAEAVLKCDCD